MSEIAPSAEQPSGKREGPSDRYLRSRFPGRFAKAEAALPPCVYFIRDDASGLIKIGFAADAATRLHRLQVGNPGKLTLLAYVRCKNAQEVEEHLHTCFWRHRARGEWFEPSIELLRMIRVVRNEASGEEMLDSVCHIAAATGHTMLWAVAAHGVSLERWQTSLPA